MIQLPSKENCCGCMGCKDICPVDAINAQKDSYGFIYPSVNKDSCMDCGLCMSKCAFSNKDTNHNEPQSVWAYRINSKNALKESTSGGVFTALSDIVLAKNGAISGCVLNDDFSVCHILTYDENVRNKMRRSKYVQSDTNGIYKKIKDVLKDGTIVLFVGTPCQVAQIAEYLCDYREQLILCDFLCHGVPNNDFFKAHIDFLEKIYTCDAKSYLFRGKKYGWNHMLEEIVLKNGKVKGSKKVQSYSKFFYSGVSLRPSCENCHYRSMNRSSDITIGDFWGIEKIIGKTDNCGYSLIMANTLRGEEIVQQLKSCGEIFSVDKETIYNRVCEPLRPCKIDKEEFWDLYLKDGYSGVVKKYTDTSVKSEIIHQVKKTIKRALK